MGLNSISWYDSKGCLIKAGDYLRNPCNEPPILKVLEKEGVLYLDDYDTPFDTCYGFDTFWTIYKY